MNAALLVASLLVGGWLVTGTALAGTPRDYAYLLVQGTISDPTGGTPLTGATVRLSTSTQAFEAVTDERGVFVFEKLPIAAYEMRVTSRDGEVIRNIEKTGLDVPELKRFKIRFGKGEARPAFLEAREDGVTVVAPDPPVRWKRFWTQFVIFVGAAAALAM